MLKKFNVFKLRSIISRSNRSFARIEEDVTLSYSELINKVSGIELPKNYLNTKFSDIVKHIEPTIKKEEAQTASLTIKTREFSLDQDGYMKYILKNPVGTYEVFKHKDRQIKIMGFNYANMILGNLWKTMLFSQCDVMLLAVKPDLMLKDFKLNLKNPKTQEFSNRLYYQQLEISPMNIRCNQETEDKVAKYIDSIFLSNTPSRVQSDEDCKTNSIYKCCDKITEEMLSLSLLFAKRKSIPVVLGDMPDLIYREHFANQLTVGQFKQILAESTLEAVINPDIQPNTPLNVYISRMPEYALQPSDSYISSLIEYMIKKTNYKKILVIGGLGQSFGIKTTLQNRLPIQLDEVMVPPELKKDIYGNILLEDFIEKQSLYDVFSMGKLILQKNENLFKNSQALIEKYSELEPGHPKLTYYKKMHSDFVYHHFKHYSSHYKKGIEKKEDYFIQKTIEMSKR